ncbi:hypothetical protein, partial [Streptomyces nanshensis]
MYVRWRGRWQLCVVRARADWADGRVVYHVDLRLWRSGAWDTYPTALVWDPAAMRPYRPSVTAALAGGSCRWPPVAR